MNSLTFKQGTAHNFEGFYSLFSSSLKKQFLHYGPNVVAYYLTVDYSKTYLKEQIENGKKIIFLGIDNKKKVIGYLYAGKVYGGVGTAFWIAVEPSYQKKGVASQLLKMWEEYVNNHRGHALHLWTTKEKIHFYQKRGFTQIGEFPHVWFGVNLFCFYKKLKEPKEENYLREFLKSQKK